MPRLLIARFERRWSLGDTYNGIGDDGEWESKRKILAILLKLKRNGSQRSTPRALRKLELWA